MTYKKRTIETAISAALSRGKSILLLGPRQTGKTTMLKMFQPDMSVNLARTDERRFYEADPSRLRCEIASLPRPANRAIPLVMLDEIQLVPALLDEAQTIIDSHAAQFALTGSSARKLRRAGVNLLPGRVVSLKMDPLSIAESPDVPLDRRLAYGAMPGIMSVPDDKSRQLDLDSYVDTYLQEEIRQEAIVRNLGAFARFLELAASESGLIVNFSDLASRIGVTHTTINSYYGILEDCLIAERVEPISASPVRKRLTKSPRHLFFDLGVRRVAAREDENAAETEKGRRFEQFVGLELLRHIRSNAITSARLRFWRDPAGPEVDWVVERGGKFIPVEVKYRETPTLSDARHLRTFMREYPTDGIGYIVCRAPRPQRLASDILALPWQQLPSVFDNP
ncbi:MAG: ATP-binding protein [Lentisphaeria bacterium]|nr:ATP-binding protein [Lentisphaeria bacterium]